MRAHQSERMRGTGLNFAIAQRIEMMVRAVTNGVLFIVTGEFIRGENK